MIEAAGEVADGLICHTFTTERYTREVIIPAAERGRAAAGLTLEGFDVAGHCCVVTGRTEDEFASSKRAAQQRLAFYGSTPAYRPVLELHGWGDLQSELHALSTKGEWAQMATLIDDDVLAAFAVVGSWEELPDLLLKRWDGCATRFNLEMPSYASHSEWAEVLRILHAR
jgi:probable F420-dependent oxidoreductase